MHKYPTTKRAKVKDEYYISIVFSIPLTLVGIALIIRRLMHGESDSEIMTFTILYTGLFILPGIFFAYRALKTRKKLSELEGDEDKDILDELDELDERKWGKKYWLKKAEAEPMKNQQVQDGEYVTILSYFNTTDAEIAKTNLSHEGIECIFLDENITTINPLLNVAVGGIKLQVKKDDVKRAMEILTPNTKTPRGG